MTQPHVVSQLLSPQVAASATTSVSGAASAAGSLFQGLVQQAQATITAAPAPGSAAASIGIPAWHGSNHAGTHHGHHAHGATDATADTADGGDSSGAVTTGAFADTGGDASGSAVAQVDGGAQSTADALSGDLMRSIQAYVSGGSFSAASLSSVSPPSFA